MYVHPLSLSETCKKEVYAKPDAHQQSNRVVKQGTEQKFSCSYFCNGNYINGTVNWKNRTGDIIPNNTKYQQRIQRTFGGNGPSIVHTLTVTNVEESDDDFTCILNQPNKEQIKHTFHLEPEGQKLYHFIRWKFCSSL